MIPGSVEFSYCIHLNSVPHLPEFRTVFTRIPYCDSSANGTFKLAQGFSPGTIGTPIMNSLSPWESPEFPLPLGEG